MRVGQIVAIVFIFAGASVAWLVLGLSVSERTNESLQQLREQVAGLWGTPLTQYTPDLKVQETETYTEEDAKGNKVKKTRLVYTELVPQSAEIKVSLVSDARRKGLLWYRTFGVEFDGVYTVKHNCSREPYLIAQFRFPSERALYDDFVFTVNEKEASGVPTEYNMLKNQVELPPGQTATVHIRYKSRGLDNWSYKFSDEVAEVKNFSMVVATNYDKIDFPAGTMSPSEKRQTGDGWELTWSFTKLITGFNIGVEMPDEPNAGQMATRISFFAPVGLLFFITVLVLIGAISGRNLHPVHYFFVAGGFFAFHLLMAYLADHLEIRTTFAVCAVVSVLLVVSYLIRVIGAGFTFKVVAPAQLLFLVLFSYSFFFKGYTGLAITVASILTLAVLMHITAKVDWSQLGGRNGSGPSAPPRRGGGPVEPAAPPTGEPSYTPAVVRPPAQQQAGQVPPPEAPGLP